MTKLFDKAVQRIREMSPQQQDEAAEVLISIAQQDNEAVQLSADQIAEIKHRLSEPAVYATDEQVESLFQKMGI
ncbi:MAG: hypothetical protein HN834_23905 [Rhodospirillaceae bacterium]|jgi:hypothetical protein|nr:hypothetical protein [Rhodospirillaceae bacterium]MBT4688875.1 hypothetical protein [Rhodospirillaceae bacterium]MBT5079609.1 hypothetical protein [Rhodospirillaceae bacterium]MBT6910828.1 hypothetical protein [Rhodospirillaceae bacterium]MBT6987435.1 hypothetical protein [Rhodospirillaceae bacterium]